MDLTLILIETFAWSLLVFAGLASMIGIVMGYIDRTNGVQYAFSFNSDSESNSVGAS